MIRVVYSRDKTFTVPPTYTLLDICKEVVKNYYSGEHIDSHARQIYDSFAFYYRAQSGPPHLLQAKEPDIPIEKMNSEIIELHMNAYLRH